MSKQAKIYIAGHHSLVGTALMRNLRVRGFDNFVIRTYAELDLINQATKNRVITNCDYPGNEERRAAVLMDVPLSVETKIALIGALSEAIGRPVDLIDLRAIGESILGQILKYGVRLLGSDTDYAELIKRHLFDEADFMPYRRRILAERRLAWIGK